MDADVMIRMLAVFILGLAPISEVRGAIPLAYKFFMIDLESPKLFAVACACGVLGNLAIAPLVLLALDKIERVVLGSRYVPGFIKKLYLKVLHYVRGRARKYERIEMVGLLAFVAVPLPFTGAWTGSLVAYVLGLDRKKSIACIELGVLIATAIVLSALTAFTTLLKVFGIEL